MSMFEKLGKAITFFRGLIPDEHGTFVNEYAAKDFEAGQKLADALTNGLNGGSRKPYMLGILYGLRKSHRYLQNEAVWTLLEALGRLPDLEGQDARNESGLEACRKVREALSERIYWEGL